jgi:probable HAF family extracellular repeat protein
VDFEAGFGNIGLSVNNLGQVVGASTLAGNETTHGFLWSRGTGMRDLGTLAGDVQSFAAALNEQAQVVGGSFDPEGKPRGYLWERGQMTDFNDLVGSDSPLYVLLNFSINDRGEVAGFGATDDGEIHAFVARPVHGALAGDAMSGTRSAPESITSRILAAKSRTANVMFKVKNGPVSQKPAGAPKPVKNQEK